MLADVIDQDLRLVICGTAAGAKSAKQGEYYAGPGNRFWTTLAEVGLTTRLLTPAESHELLGFGVGLTDIVKNQAGSDSEIDFAAGSPDALREKMREFAPKLLCFNGKRAAVAHLRRKSRSICYGLQSETIASTRLFVAPSTSAAAKRYWDLAVWRELAELVKRE